MAALDCRCLPSSNLPFSNAKQGLSVPQKDDGRGPSRPAAGVAARETAYPSDVAIAGSPHSDAPARARAWHHAGHAAVCDVIEPWAYGTVARATR
jgi:hypothetical protein